MADPKDDITVEVGLSLDKDDVAKVTAQLKALAKAIGDGNEIQAEHHKLQEKLRKETAESTKALKAKTEQARKLDDRVKRMTNSFHKINKVTSVFGNFVKKYAMGSVMALTKVMMPAVLGLAALGAGFLAAKVAVVAADLAVRAWNVTLKALPAAVAVGLGAVAAFTAAVAEVQAAANLPFYRQAGGQTQQGLANIYNSLLGDPQTAMLGAQSITATTNALMQAKVPLGQIQQTVKGLGGLGFYAGGGDAAAGLSNIVGAITQIGKDKNASMSAQELESLAASFGPLSDKIKEVGKSYVGKDFQEFVAFLSSSPEELGDFANGLDAANGTLIGMLKTVKGVAMAALKPFGDQIINLTKGPLGTFTTGLKDFLNSVMPSVVVFYNNLLPATFERLGGVLTYLDGFMRESLPSMVSGFREGWNTMRTFFQGTGTAIKEIWPYVQRVSEGFDILFQTILGPAIGGISRMFGGALVELTDFFENNRDSMASIGETIASIFSADGWLIGTIKSGAKAIANLISTLGPVILKMVDYLEAPFYLFDIINNNKDALQELAAGLEYFVEKAFGPFFDFVVRIIEFVVKSGPDIADIFRVAGDLLDPMIGLANVLLDILEALGGMKVIIGFLIGKAVISGIMSLAASLGMLTTASGGSVGMMGALFGSGAGGITRFGTTRRGAMMGGLGLAAGLGIAAYGATLDNPYASGIVGAGGGAIGTLSTAAGVMGPAAFTNPYVLGATALVAGGFGVYNYIRARQRQREEQFAEGALMAEPLVGRIGVGNFGTNFAAYGGLKRYVSTNTVPAGISRIPGDAGAMGEGDAAMYASTLAMYDPAIRQTLMQQFGVTQQSIDNYAGQLSRQALAPAGAELERQAFQAAIANAVGDISSGTLKFDTEAYNNLAGFVSTAGGALTTASANANSGLEEMNKTLDFLTDSFGLSVREGLMLADTLGIDLTQSTEEFTIALGYLSTEIDKAKSASQIFGEQFDLYVFEPLRALQFETEIKSLGDIINEALETQTFDDENPLALLIGRTLEGIPQEILRKLQSGEIDTTEAFNEVGSLFGEVLKDVNDPVAKAAILDFRQQVFDAISGSQEEIDAEASRLTQIFDKVLDSLDVNSTTVIDGLSTKAQEVLRSLGVIPTIDEVPVAGDTASPKASLMQTLGTHSMIDAMIAGNREISSAYRTTNLGSSMSDHIMGRALDITGDNLGAYATAMRNAGGFAEMHGSGSNRHLHVVPPTGGVGSAPQAQMLIAPTQRGVETTVQATNNITVNPAPGMNEAMLAKAVAREIARLNRDAMERS